MKASVQKQFESMMKRPIPRRKVGLIRLQMVKEAQSFYGMECMRTAKDAAEMVRPYFQYSDREMMLVVSLNARLEPMAAEIVSVGGIDGCPIDIRTMFKHAMLNGATGIICFHNHPSGDPEPSHEDFKATKQIAEAGKILGIRLHDHIIIGEHGHYSMREEDKLPYHDSLESA